MIKKLLVCTAFLFLNAYSMQNSITTKEQLLANIKNKNCDAIEALCTKMNPCPLIDEEVLKLADHNANSKSTESDEFWICMLLSRATPKNVKSPWPILKAQDEDAINF